MASVVQAHVEQHRIRLVYPQVPRKYLTVLTTAAAELFIEKPHLATKNVSNESELEPQHVIREVSECGQCNMISVLSRRG